MGRRLVARGFIGRIWVGGTPNSTPGGRGLEARELHLHFRMGKAFLVFSFGFLARRLDLYDEVACSEAFDLQFSRRAYVSA
jgi:hypothetical protein